MTSDLIPAENPVDTAVPSLAQELSEDDSAALRSAVEVLERSTLVGRLSQLAGRPVELIGRSLPAAAADAVSRATDVALKAALRVALTTLPKESRSSRGRLDTAAAMTTGALGGALGLATLPLELPVSTVLMLRSIAAVAREEGEDLSDPETALACLEVFALGSRPEGEDLMSGGYLAVRGALAKSISQAAKLAASQRLADQSAPALMRFVAQIASRFGVVVSQKVAAGAVPVLGAFGGAAVNAAFLDHFRTVARAHFTIRRLERAYGTERIQAAYREVAAKLAARAL